jgi:hypothetical protein
MNGTMGIPPSLLTFNRRTEKDFTDGACMRMNKESDIGFLFGRKVLKKNVNHRLPE